MQPGENPDDLEYLNKLDAFLSGKEQTTLYFELEKRNWAPDHSDNLSDEAVSQALTNLIWSLKDLGVYISDTDHLSDRELYKMLLDYCDEPNVCFPGNPNAAMHWSPIGSWDDEDMEVWLRHYATPEQRTEHAIENPGWSIPPFEPPQHPRPWLPVQVFPSFYEEEEDSDESAE